MAEFSRRGFFRLAAGAVAASAVPMGSLLGDVARIYCDGVRDDGPGLSALVRGDVVEFLVPDMAKHIGWHGDVLHLAGDFTILSPVKLGSECSGKTFVGGRYKLRSTLFDAKDAQGMHFREMVFECGDLPKGGSVMVLDRNVRIGVQNG